MRASRRSSYCSTWQWAVTRMQQTQGPSRVSSANSPRALQAPAGIAAVMAASSLTPEQVAKCMAPSSGWAFPAKDDGWVRAHDALRLDMADFEAALAVLKVQDAACTPLTAWQVRATGRSEVGAEHMRCATRRQRTALAPHGPNHGPARVFSNRSAR